MTTAPLGITLGDGAGVGPQLVLTTWPSVQKGGPAVVYGSVAVLEHARADLVRKGLLSPSLRVVQVTDPADDRSASEDAVAVIDVGGPVDLLGAYPWGQVVPAFGRLQHDALCAAIDAALGGDICAICTAPWHKKRMADAGLPPTGHTEVLLDRTSSPDGLMLLAGDTLRVALATTHIPLRSVAEAVTSAGLVRIGRTLRHALEVDFGLARPARIGFCGLNPHAGEEGVLGREDLEVIAPAVAELRRLGIEASGPWSGDTVFGAVVSGRAPLDAIVAMYHDQGLGPLKTFHGAHAANITCGLPIVRTSVDHGTAYDVAGTKAVDATSFLYAARLARSIARRRAASVA